MRWVAWTRDSARRTSAMTMTGTITIIITEGIDHQPRSASAIGPLGSRTTSGRAAEQDQQRDRATQ